MQPAHLAEDTIAEIVASVWDAVLGLAIERLADADEDPLPELSAAVHITGAWNGVILLWPTDPFAARAASLLFAVPETEVTADDIQDGMAELCNMIAGNLKSVLPGPSALSLPSVTRGANHRVFVRRTRPIAQLNIACDGQPLRLQVLEGSQPAATHQAALQSSGCTECRSSERR